MDSGLFVSVFTPIFFWCNVFKLYPSANIPFWVATEIINPQLWNRGTFFLRLFFKAEREMRWILLPAECKSHRSCSRTSLKIASQGKKDVSSCEVRWGAATTWLVGLRPSTVLQSALCPPSLFSDGLSCLLNRESSNHMVVNQCIYAFSTSVFGYIHWVFSSNTYMCELINNRFKFKINE